VSKYLSKTIEYLLRAAILDFISSLITFLEFIKAPKYLKFWTPSNTCPYSIRCCSKFVTFLFLFSCILLCFHQSSAYCSLFNPLNAKLNPICHLLALLGAHPILHISRIRVNVCYYLLIRSHRSSEYQHSICICCILSRSVKNCF
jgi:hypothetical protein